ncbi:hypothetical protein [Methylobacterium sp. CM6246]
MRQVIMLALLGAALGGCVTDSTPATIQGACDAFEAPKQAVRGLDKEDRRWIAAQVEAGVRVCGWSRPKAREIARQVTS